MGKTSPRSPENSTSSVLISHPSVEVTLGGWIVTYIINVRGGGPSSGYISSGFFGGLTLGRVGLLWVNKLVGDRKAVFLYGILTLAYGKKKNLIPPPGADMTRLFRLEVAIWKVPSLVGNAVMVSFVGVFVSRLRLTSYRGTVGDSVVIVGPYLSNRCQPRVQGSSSLAPHRYAALSSDHM